MYLCFSLCFPVDITSALLWSHLFHKSFLMASTLISVVGVLCHIVLPYDAPWFQAFNKYLCMSYKKNPLQIFYFRATHAEYSSAKILFHNYPPYYLLQQYSYRTLCYVDLELCFHNIFYGSYLLFNTLPK